MMPNQTLSIRHKVAFQETAVMKWGYLPPDDLVEGYGTQSSRTRLRVSNGTKMHRMTLVQAREAELKIEKGYE